VRGKGGFKLNTFQEQCPESVFEPVKASSRRQREFPLQNQGLFEPVRSAPRDADELRWYHGVHIYCLCSPSSETKSEDGVLFYFPASEKEKERGHVKW